MPASKFRVAFVHPDLGIGGAERLVVDAAQGLQKLGHDVTIYTSHHDPYRSFDETNDGTLTVKCIPPPFPRSILGKFHILLAHLRQLHLMANILLRGLYREHDVFFFDQLATGVPIIRTLAAKRVVFYCHFPDKLLSEGGAYSGERRRRGLLKAIYRWPMDIFEELTTGSADVILANSRFTSRVVARHMRSIARDIVIVYPGINVDAYKPQSGIEKNEVYSERPTFVSLNRFEEKKNVVLAVRSFARFKKFNPSRWTLPVPQRPRLVIGGGFDPRLPDNRRALESIVEALDSASLTYSISHPEVIDGSIDEAKSDVHLLLNFTSAHRSTLLNSPSTLALLYTPVNEHFGIGPVEGMLCGLPVIACDSGGPTESVRDLDTDPTYGTGWLCPPKQDAWALAMRRVIGMNAADRAAISERGRRRALDHFSMDSMAKGIEQALTQAARMGPVHWGYAVLISVWLAGMFLLYYLLSLLGVFRP